MLKLANENMSTYKAIMSISPTRDKTKVVRELTSVVREAKRDSSRSSRKKRNLITGSSIRNTTLQLTDRSSKKFTQPSIEHHPMNKSIHHDVPSLNIEKGMNGDASISSRRKNGEASISSRRKKSYREQLWEDSSQIERLVTKIQKRSGLPQSIKE